MAESTAGASDNMFQLKTLYDVSKELFEAKDTETVLQNFLLTIIGSMGVLEGLTALYDNRSGRIVPMIDRGFEKESLSDLHLACARFFKAKDFQNFNSASFERNRGEFPENIKTVIPFGLDEDTRGLLLLGERISASPFEEKDIDLLLTLTNHLVIALRNSQFLQQM